MQGKWQIRIIPDYPGDRDNLCIFRRNNYTVEVITAFDRQGIVIEKKEEGDTFRGFPMRVHEMRELVEAFVEYAKIQGFKDSTDTFNKGKLEATEKHLEDMRTLVFKP